MKTIHWAALLGAVVALAAMPAWSADAKTEGKSDIKTDKDKLSYAVGFQIGQQLKRDGMAVDVVPLSQAIADVLGGKDLRMTLPEMKAAVEAYQAKRGQERDAAGEKNKKAGEDFLAANKKKPGVKVTASGLQYKVVQEGTGKSPTADSTVVAHYRGTLINGKEFDSSYKRNEPATFPVSGVIPGWKEVLPLMKVGAKYQVFIPADLAYGAHGAGADIGPNEALVFDIELVEVK